MGGTIDIDCDAEGRGRCSSGSGDGFHSSNGADSRGYSGNSSVGGYPSGGRTSGDGYSGTMSSGGGVGSSYVATNHDLRIRSTYKALADGEEWKPGAYYGCSADNTRKNKETNGLSSNLVYTVNEIKIYSGFHPAKGFVFSDCNLTARDMEYLSSNLPSINHTFDLVDFSCNPQIGPLGLDHLVKGAHGIVSLQSGNHDINLMYQGMLTRPGFNTVKLDLSNCNIGDIGADILGHALASGKLPATKKINISGNNITQDVDTKIVQALKSVEQDIVVFTHTLDEINKMGGDEGKEAQITALKNIIERGKAAGTYNEALVVDKSFLGNLKNTFKVGELGLEQIFGFGKCHLLPEPEQVVESCTQDKIIASLPQKTASGLSFAKKYVGKLISFHDIVTCFVGSYEDSVTSELGQEIVKHELCVVGVDEFCGE